MYKKVLSIFKILVDRKVMLLKGIQFLHTIIGAYLIDPTVVQFLKPKEKQMLYRLYLRKKS